MRCSVPLTAPLQACRAMRVLTLCLAVAGVFGAATGYASLPGGAELQRLHDVLNAPQAPVQLPATAPSLVPEETPLPIDTKAAKTEFTLKGVQIEGATLYKPETFLRIFADANGQRITVQKLYELVNEITQIYRNDGYILSRAILPPQDITAGLVKIQVMEGRLSAVEITGFYQESPLLQRYAEPLTEGVLHNDTLERALLLMNDIPGVTATSTLQPGTTPGTAKLVIYTTTDKISGSVAISNWATRYMGPNSLEADATVNDVLRAATGWHDSTTVRMVQSSNLKHVTYLDILHVQPFFYTGAKLKINGHYSQSEPGWTMTDLEINSESSGFSVELEYPHVRTRKASLSSFYMFDWRDTITLTEDKELSADHIRALRFGLNWNSMDDWNGLTTGKVEISHGMGVLGASHDGEANLSRSAGQGSDFWKVKLDWARLQRLGRSWNFLLATSMQYASDPLLAGEEFNFGGENYGRGYGTSEITGDRAIAAKAELHLNFPVGWKYLTHWQLFGFYDFGATWQKDRGDTESNKPSTLASVGWGVRSQLTNRLSLDFTMAKPLSGVAESGGQDDPNMYLRVRNQF